MSSAWQRCSNCGLYFQQPLPSGGCPQCSQHQPPSSVTHAIPAAIPVHAASAAPPTKPPEANTPPSGVVASQPQHLRKVANPSPATSSVWLKRIYVPKPIRWPLAIAAALYVIIQGWRGYHEKDPNPRPQSVQPVQPASSYLAQDEKAVRSFLDAVINGDQAHADKFVHSLAGGSKITEYTVTGYEILNTSTIDREHWSPWTHSGLPATSQISATVIFRSRAGTDIRKTMRFKVDKGYIVDID